jgi:hypothetical protein
VTIASRNVALSHGNNKKTATSELAATETTAIGRQPGSRRTASAIVSGASTPVAIINATIGVGEAILAILQELRSRSKEEKKGSRSKEAKKGRAFRQDQDPRGSEGRNL